MKETSHDCSRKQQEKTINLEKISKFRNFEVSGFRNFKNETVSILVFSLDKTSACISLIFINHSIDSERESSALIA
jgi:hypothetical protein